MTIEWLPGVDGRLHATRGGPVLCGTGRSDDVAWPEAPRCSTCIHLTTPVQPPRPPAPEPEDSLYRPLLPRIPSPPFDPPSVEPRPGEHPAITRARLATAEREAEIRSRAPYPDQASVARRLAGLPMIRRSAPGEESA